MPEMNIGTLVGYLKLDDSGIDKGTRSAESKLKSFSRTGEKLGSDAGQKIGRATGEQIGKASTDAIGRSESAIKSKLSTTFKRAATGLGLAAGAAIGATVFGGFKQAVNEQEARKVLGGLYGDANLAKQTLKGLAEVSRTSPIDYSSYQKAAESLAYAGVKGDEAVGILKNVGLAVTAAGGSSENISRASDAILKMVNAGKITLDTLQQLSDSGVPILSGLAAHFDTTIADVNRMASAGQIQLQDVLDVMQNATGDTFQSMLQAGQDATQSFSNQWKIAKDNVTRAIGQALLPTIQSITPAISKVADFISDDLVPTISTLVGWIGKIPGPVKLGLTALAGYTAFSRLGVFTKLASRVDLLGGKLKSLRGLGPKGTFKSLAKAAGPGGAIALGITAIGLLTQAYRDARAPIADVNALIDENTGKTKDNARANLAAALAKEGILSATSKLGVKEGEVTKALLHGGKAYDELIAKIKDYKRQYSLMAQTDQGPIGSVVDLFTDESAADKVRTAEQLLSRLSTQRQKVIDAQRAGKQALSEMDAAQEKSNDAATAGAAAQQRYLQQLRAQHSLSGQVTDAQAQQKEAYYDLADAAQTAYLHEQQRTTWASESIAAGKRTAAAMHATADAMQEAADKAHDLTGRASELETELARLSGRNVTAEQATRAFNGVLSRMKDAAKDADGNVQKLGKGIVGASGAINTATRSGQDLYDNVTSLAKAAQDRAFWVAEVTGKVKGQKAAEDAAAKSLEASRQAFIDSADQMGLTAEQAKRLADRYFGIPKDIKTVIKGDFTDVDTKLQNLKQLAADGFTIPVRGQYTGTNGLPTWSTTTIAHATGGAIIGPGPKGKDSQLRVLAPGEHVLTADDVDAMGGQGNVYAFRKMLHDGFGMASGGQVGNYKAPSASALAGTQPVRFGPYLTSVLSAADQFRAALAATGTAASQAAEKARAAAKAYKQQLIDQHDTAKRHEEAVARASKSANAAVTAAKKRLAQLKKNAGDSKAARDHVATAERNLARAQADRITTIRDAIREQTRSRRAEAAKTAEAKKAYQQASKAAAQTKVQAAVTERLIKASRGAVHGQSILAKELDRTNRQIDATKGKLADLRSARKQLSSSISGKITGDASILNMDANGVGGLIAGLRSNLKQAQGLRSNLDKLATAGLDTGILQQVAGVGLAGGPLAQALAGASAGQIKRLNSLQSRIERAASRSGSLVAGVSYNPQIVTERQVLAVQQATAQSFERLLTRNANQLEEAMGRALGGVSFRLNIDGTWIKARVEDVLNREGRRLAGARR